MTLVEEKKVWISKRKEAKKGEKNTKQNCPLCEIILTLGWTAWLGIQLENNSE